MKNVELFKRNGSYTSLTPEHIKTNLTKYPIFNNDPDLLSASLLFFGFVYGRIARKPEYRYSTNFRPLSSDLLTAIFGKEYRDYLNFFVKHNFLLIDETYQMPTGSSKGKCKGYKLPEEYYFQKPLARILNKSPKMMRIIANVITILNKEKSNPEFALIYKKTESIDIDIEGAIMEVDRLCEEKGFHKNSDDYNDYKSALIASISAISDMDGLWRYANVSSTNGRYTHNICSLKKELRGYLFTIDNTTGEILDRKVEIDGKNTQPLLLCIYALQQGAEIEQEFIDKVKAGTIYDDIAADMGLTGEINGKKPRYWVKDRFMDTLLYTKDNGKYTLTAKYKTSDTPKKLNSKRTNKKPIDPVIESYKKMFYMYFSKKYPKFNNWLINKKIELCGNVSIPTTNKKNLGGSRLAIIIQRMESELWINGVLKSLMTEFGESKIFCTIHDSVLIFNPSDDDIKFISDKFTELSEKLYGIRMPFAVEEIKKPEYFFKAI